MESKEAMVRNENLLPSKEARELLAAELPEIAWGILNDPDFLTADHHAALRAIDKALSHRSSGREVLEALREPTDAMRKAGFEHCPTEYLAVWQAMIDEGIRNG